MHRCVAPSEVSLVHGTCSLGAAWAPSPKLVFSFQSGRGQGLWSGPAEGPASNLSLRRTSAPLTMGKGTRGREVASPGSRSRVAPAGPWLGEHWSVGPAAFMSSLPSPRAWSIECYLGILPPSWRPSSPIRACPRPIPPCLSSGRTLTSVHPPAPSPTTTPALPAIPASRASMVSGPSGKGRGGRLQLPAD